MKSRTSKISGVVVVLLGFLFAKGNSQVASEPTCTAEGKFELQDGSCSNYYVCLYDGMDYQLYKFKCANGSLFDPGMQTCVPSSNYWCVQTTTESPNNGTTSPAPCLRFGRFAKEDPTCRQYYLCFWDGISLTRIDLKCPNSLRFDPTLERCVLEQNYPCP